MVAAGSSYFSFIHRMAYLFIYLFFTIRERTYIKTNRLCTLVCAELWAWTAPDTEFCYPVRLFVQLWEFWVGWRSITDKFPTWKHNIITVLATEKQFSGFRGTRRICLFNVSIHFEHVWRYLPCLQRVIGYLSAFVMAVGRVRNTRGSLKASSQNTKGVSHSEGNKLIQEEAWRNSGQQRLCSLA